MKKLLALGLSLVMILSLAACGTTTPTTEAPTEAPTTVAPTTQEPTTEEPTTEPVPEVKIFSYEEFMAAEKDSEVTIEAYVQFSAYNQEYGNTSLFLADQDGGYFVYRMKVTPEEAALLKEGTKIRVHGFKTEWSGEVEFSEGESTFEVVEGGDSYVAEAKDVTDLFGTDELITYMNQKVFLSGAVVAPSTDANGNEAAFLYKYNGSGADGDDLYFNVSVGGETYTLTVESDECGAGTEVYEAVKALEIGQVIELEGFLYWYEGPQPHVHKVTNMAAKGEGAMTFEEYRALAEDTKAVVEGWIQLASYNEAYGNINIFLADPDGAYYVWRMNVTPEEAAQLTVGTKIRVEGMKTSWQGQVEIEDASFTVLESGVYVASPVDVTDVLADAEAAAAFANLPVGVKGMTVVASVDADGNEVPFLYKENGSGQEGDDIYFAVGKGDARYTFVVESDEWGADSAVYKAVKELKIGDVIDLTGFLYWYVDPQLHVSGIAASEETSDLVMNYELFTEAAVDDPVSIIAYIRLASAYSEEKGMNLFLSDGEGAYYVYQLKASEDVVAQLVPGTKIKVTGTKSVWSGEVEITDASVEILETGTEFDPGMVNVKAFGPDELIHFMNQEIILEAGMVEASVNADGEQVPFLYKWNGSGQDGDDIYFKVSAAGLTWTFVVESDEFAPGTEVYEAAKALTIGQGVDVYAFMYWYEGPQPHVARIETNWYEKSAEDVLSYGEYRAIDPADEQQVTVEGWVQLAAYNAEYGNASIFLHDKIGAYYVYRMNITEEDAAKLVPGAYLKLTGYKKAWSGMVEIADVEAYEFLEEHGEFTAETLDFAMIAQDEELLHSLSANPVVIVPAVVVASTDGEGKEAAWLYSYNGTGSDGDDIYFNILLEGKPYTVVVESDEFGAGSEVYEAAKTLEIGDVVEMNAFLYWYEGPQPHITSIEKMFVKPEGVMKHAEFLTAEDDAPVTVEGFVQLISAYNEEYGNCSVYLDDITGGYYVYRMAVTPEQYAQLFEGLYIRVNGFKTTWSGEVEVKDAEGFEIPEDLPLPYFSAPVDLGSLGDEAAIQAQMNRRFRAEGAKVVASKDADGKEVAFLYSWNGSGQDGDDLYFTVELGGNTYTLTVETDECAAGTDVYETVKNLKVGDTLNLEGFLYWYEGPQPHVTAAEVVPAE